MMLLFQVIIGLMAWLGRHPVLAIFLILGALLGVYTYTTLGADGNLATAYNGATPVNWSSDPAVMIPAILSGGQCILAILKGFKKL